MKALLPILALLAGTAATAQTTVQVDAPWVRGTVTGQPATGAFMRLTPSAHARLVAARSPVAGVVEIHEMAMDGDVMKMRRWLQLHHLGWPPLADAVIRHVQSVIGARFRDIAPLRSIRKARCAVMLVHGMDDETVPFDDALRLWHVRPDAEILPVAGGHDLRAALTPHAPRIVEFLHRAMTRARSSSPQSAPP